MSIHFEWTPEMSVGEKTIDAQHERLLNQVNKIIDAVAFNRPAAEVSSALDFLDQYVREHFAYEEEYMQRLNYPALAAHQAMHHSFNENYERFKQRLGQGEKPEEIIFEIEKYLGTWWLEHIGHEDKRYFDYAQGHQA